MMDLESAIQHCEEVAEEKEEDAILYHNCATYNQNLYEKGLAENTEKECRVCAEEHRQLAEWLKELKTSRECIERIRIACLCPGLRGDGFEDEIVNAMNEYLYDMGKEWEE